MHTHTHSLTRLLTHALALGSPVRERLSGNLKLPLGRMLLTTRAWPRGARGSRGGRGQRLDRPAAGSPSRPALPRHAASQSLCRMRVQSPLLSCPASPRKGEQGGEAVRLALCVGGPWHGPRCALESWFLANANTTSLAGQDPGPAALSSVAAECKSPVFSGKPQTGC